MPVLEEVRVEFDVELVEGQAESIAMLAVGRVQEGTGLEVDGVAVVVAPPERPPATDVESHLAAERCVAVQAVDAAAAESTVAVGEAAAVAVEAGDWTIECFLANHQSAG